VYKSKQRRNKNLATCWTTGVRFPAGAGIFISLCHRVQTGHRPSSASYPMGTWASFPGDKAAGTWSWSLICI